MEENPITPNSDNTGPESSDIDPHQGRRHAIKNHIRRALAAEGIQPDDFAVVELQRVLDVLDRNHIHTTPNLIAEILGKEVEEIEWVMEDHLQQVENKRQKEMDVQQNFDAVAIEDNEMHAAVPRNKRDALAAKIQQLKCGDDPKDLTRTIVFEHALNNEPLDWQHMQAYLMPNNVNPTEALKYYRVALREGMKEGWLEPIEQLDREYQTGRDVIAQTLAHPENIILDNTASPEDIRIYMEDLRSSLLALNRGDTTFIDQVMRLLVMQQLVAGLRIDQASLEQARVQPIQTSDNTTVQLTEDEWTDWLAREYENELVFQISVHGFGIKDFPVPEREEANPPPQE